MLLGEHPPTHPPTQSIHQSIIHSVTQSVLGLFTLISPFSPSLIHSLTHSLVLALTHSLAQQLLPPEPRLSIGWSIIGQRLRTKALHWWVYHWPTPHQYLCLYGGSDHHNQIRRKLQGYNGPSSVTRSLMTGLALGRRQRSSSLTQ